MECLLSILFISTVCVFFEIENASVILNQDAGVIILNIFDISVDIFGLYLDKKPMATQQMIISDRGRWLIILSIDSQYTRLSVPLGGGLDK